MRKLKNTIKTIAYKSPLWPTKRYICFESKPDASDNTKAVFDEMLRRGMNKKYKFIWFLFGSHSDDHPKIKNVKYVSVDKKASYRFHRYFAKAFICCNEFLPPVNITQFSMFLNHGTPLKNCGSYYNMPNEIKYCLCNSVVWEKPNMEILKIASQSKMVSLGFPRNDILTAPQTDLHPYFNCDFKKTIVWYPTFRQHKGGSKTGADHALPIIWNEEKAIETNECAKSNNVLIVLKPHFAQDVSKIKYLNLSNIVFIDDDFFKENSISSYRFVGSCDALLTDYSSIYYDYTLCNKPIGLIWEDYDQYDKNPGFAVDMGHYMKGGVKIYTLEDFKSFITDVANGIDTLKSEREEIRDECNYSTDGKNTERVVDFIVEKARL